MSGFSTKQFNSTGPTTLIKSPDTNRLTMTFNSFDETTSYLMFVDGVIQCSTLAGVVQYDIIFNGKKLHSRSVQTSSNMETTSIGTHWPLKCADCKQVTESDGTISYRNELVLQFVWTPVANLINVTLPTIENVSISVLATA